MPLGRRQLFIYWRVDAANGSVARQAASEMQGLLLQQHPALRAGLFVRADATGAELTLMETYALESPGADLGISTTLQQQIEVAGAAALQPWLSGKRHVEVFDACGGSNTPT